MNEYQNIKSLEFSLVGKECHLTGTFNFNGHTRIAGHLDGEINLNNDAILCIEPNGSIKGTINCNDLEIYGYFDGEILSTGKVSIYPPAHVNGILKSKTLEVYPGAILNVDGFTQAEGITS
jgi:cytoskeletal protein CcmA (bactofilin family)